MEPTISKGGVGGTTQANQGQSLSPETKTKTTTNPATTRNTTQNNPKTGSSTGQGHRPAG
jgi:hypothetical protein